MLLSNSSPAGRTLLSDHVFSHITITGPEELLLTMVIRRLGDPMAVFMISSFRTYRVAAP